MTDVPREKREEKHDPVTSGAVRIAAVAAAMRAVKAEPRRDPKEDDETPAVPRAA